MSIRKTKPFSIYPTADLRHKLEGMAFEKEMAASRVAIRLIRRGLERWEKRKAKTNRRQPAMA